MWLGNLTLIKIFHNCKMSSFLLLLNHLPTLYSSPSLPLLRTPHQQFPSLKPTKKLPLPKPLTVPFSAVTDPSSSSSSPSPESPQSLLQRVSDSFVLPSEFFEQLPSDLRLDLNDAAFDLSNGPVLDECGQELGELLLNLSRAWERGDTSTSQNLASKLPELEASLTGNAKSALGIRLVSAGRRFQSMGLFGNGEMQKIAQAMITSGKALAASSVDPSTNKPMNQTKVFKFGELQVAITAQKAYIGGVISFIFGILSWELGQGVQSIPENSLQYANDNALLLAKSLRGVLLALSYSSAVLSAATTVGLFLLGRDLNSKEE